MLMAPVRVPAALGVKVTLRVQEAPGFTALPQLLVWAKSPLMVMLVISKGRRKNNYHQFVVSLS